MIKSATILLVFISVLSSYSAKAQRLKFTTDTAYLRELNIHIQKSHKREMIEPVYLSFSNLWNSDKLTPSHKNEIIKLSNNLLKKRANAYPHFYNFMNLYINIINSDLQFSNIANWTKSFEYYSRQKKFSSAKIDRLFKTVNNFIEKRIFYENRAVKWTFDTDDYQLVFNEADGLKIQFNKTNLICYAKRDSFIVQNTKGYYSPDKHIWVGAGGKISWERANFSPDSVFATILDYKLNLTRSELKADSVKFTNKHYFSSVLLGKFEEKIIANAKGEKASYPQFESYNKRVDIPQIVSGVDYTGGFLMKGAKFLGKGEGTSKAILYFHKNKEPIARATSEIFLFSKDRIFSKSTQISIVLGEDSLYSTGVDLNYLIKNRRILLTNSSRNEIGSVFIDTYHDLDISIQQISFSLQDSMIYFKTPPATTYRKAVFKSYNYYSDDEYERLNLMDNIHPLEAINMMHKKGLKFFKPKQLAAYLKKDVGATKRLMYILAKKGFIYYDRNTQIANAEQKLLDFVKSKFRSKDYDEIEIVSEPKSGNNATINLNNMVMTINGTKPFALSNNRRVGIIPKNNILRIKENLEIDFDGKLQAGLTTLYGYDLTFHYDSFLVDLRQIDSLKIIYRSEEKNDDSLYDHVPLASVIEDITGKLYIDEPQNKAGNVTIPHYPIIRCLDTSYVFYDRNNEHDTIYSREEVHFVNYPFEIDSLNTINKNNIAIKGMFKSNGILPDFEEFLTVQNDSSLGFVHKSDTSALELYNGLAAYEKTISINNKGLKGAGIVYYLNAHVSSENFAFFPDSMNATTNEFILDMVNNEPGKTEYPEGHADSTYIHWEPNLNQMFISTIKDSINLFEDRVTFVGTLKLTPEKLGGSGLTAFADAYLKSDNHVFYAEKFTADTADFNLKPDEQNKKPLLTYNVNSNIDLTNNLGFFKSNGNNSYIDFPVNNYKCYMNYYTWFMDENTVEIGSFEKFKKKALKTNLSLLNSLSKISETNTLEDRQFTLSDTSYTAEELLAGSKFVSTHPKQDSLSFIARSSTYDASKNIIIAKGVKIIKVADAHIYPSGVLVINKGAHMSPLNNARIVANISSRYHKFYGAAVNISGAKKYTASGDYEYYDRQDSVSIIHFDKLLVNKKIQTEAFGKIGENEKFELSPEFGYFGDVSISANNELLNFDGYTKLNHECSHRLASYWTGFRSDINPDSVVIPLPKATKDKEHRNLYNSIFYNNDSLGVYPSFLTQRKKYSDKQLLSAKGLLYYNKKTGYYEITDSAKLVNPEIDGNYLSLHKKLCIAMGEGKINFNLKLGQVKLNSAGKIWYNLESASFGSDIMLGVNFYFHEGALNYMADKLNDAYELEAVDATKKRFKTALKELVGYDKSKELLNEVSLMGSFTSSLPEMEKTIFFSDVEMTWDRNGLCYRSKGLLGIGSINGTAVNKRVNGHIELIPKRSGDVINIYLPINDNNWFFFTYTRGTLKSLSSFDDYNDYIVDLKDKERKPPVKDTKNPYMFYPASKRNKDNFMKHIAKLNSTNEPGDFDENILTPDEQTETNEIEENIAEPELELEEIELEEINEDEKNEETNKEDIKTKNTTKKDTKKKDIKKKEKTEEEEELPEEEELLEEELLLEEEEGGG